MSFISDFNYVIVYNILITILTFLFISNVYERFEYWNQLKNREVVFGLRSYFITSLVVIFLIHIGLYLVSGYNGKIYSNGYQTTSIILLLLPYILPSLVMWHSTLASSMRTFQQRHLRELKSILMRKFFVVSTILTTITLMFVGIYVVTQKNTNSSFYNPSMLKVSSFSKKNEKFEIYVEREYFSLKFIDLIPLGSKEVILRNVTKDEEKVITNGISKELRKQFVEKYDNSYFLDLLNNYLILLYFLALGFIFYLYEEKKVLDRWEYHKLALDVKDFEDVLKLSVYSRGYSV